MKFSKLIAWTLLVTTCVASVSCDDEDDQPKIVQIHINHFLQPIKGTPLFLSTQGFWVQDKTDPGTWVLRSTPIEGFDFEWGYSYDLLIEETEYPKGTQDVAGPAWKLKQIVKKTKAAEDVTFALYLSSGESIGNVSVDEELNFTLVNGITINCGSLCEEFAEKLAEQNEINANWPVTAYFKHVNNTTLELVAVVLEN